jgi:uncharacterized protein with HEPN domain
MSREWTLHLDDIITSCEKARHFTRGLDQAAFLANQLVYDAVVRNLEVVSEAANHIPDEVLATAPGVDWDKIRGLRIILAHCCFRIDPDILWSILSTKIPELLATAQSMRKTLC